jgi:hypothetical protein
MSFFFQDAVIETVIGLDKKEKKKFSELNEDETDVICVICLMVPKGAIFCCVKCDAMQCSAKPVEIGKNFGIVPFAESCFVSLLPTGTESPKN